MAELATLGPEALRGKVVLIDLWTYTCINWLRTAPYVRAGADSVYTSQAEFKALISSEVIKWLKSHERKRHLQQSTNSALMALRAQPQN
jgi:hypothetical protein